MGMWSFVYCGGGGQRQILFSRLNWNFYAQLGKNLENTSKENSEKSTQSKPEQVSFHSCNSIRWLEQKVQIQKDMSSNQHVP